MKTFRLGSPIRVLLFFASVGTAAPLSCDFSQYQPTEGIRAELKGDLLQLSWEGAAHQQVQVSFGLEGTSPVIREMSVRKMGSAKVILTRPFSRRLLKSLALSPLVRKSSASMGRKSGSTAS